MATTPPTPFVGRKKVKRQLCGAERKKGENMFAYSPEETIIETQGFAMLEGIVLHGSVC